jgi:predicted dehydrogenase
MNRFNSRRQFIRSATFAGAGVTFGSSAFSQIIPVNKPLVARVGIIGLDTSHSPAFSEMLNNPNAAPEFAGFPVTIAYPYGSKDIESSAKRIPEITEQVKKLGVKIAGSIEELLNESDVVLLETNDGRMHLEQAMQVIRAKKRMFIDKPVAASLADVITIYDEAKKNNVPVFSCSALRFTTDTQEAASGKLTGKITGAETYTPAHLEKTHPDLFWYGIHGIESLFTIMGPGCKEVTRVKLEGTDFVTGTWNDGRVGTFRGLRSGKEDYGATIFGETGIQYISGFKGYEPLVKEIVQFFKTGVEPVKPEDTIEIYTFMEAAHESSKRGGIPITLQSVRDKMHKRKR